MSSATPIASSVWEVLLYTSEPSASREPTSPLASAAVAARSGRMPLRSSAAAALAIRSSEASSANSADTAASGRATTFGAVTAYLPPPPVAERHSHRSLADRRCAAFDRPAAHVTRGEDTGQTGLQRQRLPGQRPAGARIRGDIAAGHQVSGTVGDQPDPLRAVGVWSAADADEHRTRPQPRRFGAVLGAHDDRSEAVVGLHPDRLRAHPHINIPESRHVVDEVLRHRSAEVVPADEQRHLLSVPGEPDDRLAR